MNRTGHIEEMTDEHRDGCMSVPCTIRNVVAAVGYL